jgi:hypothetical protein
MLPVGIYGDEMGRQGWDWAAAAQSKNGNGGAFFAVRRPRWPLEHNEERGCTACTAKSN